MPIDDVWIVIRFWGALFVVGAAAFPLTRRLFPSWHDEGYFFSKAVGMALIAWIVYILGMARIAPFGAATIVGAVGAVFVFGVFFNRSPRLPRSPKWKTILIEELFFLAALLFWSWVKAHESSIRGLEKFMDYGFMQSILNGQYFPATDMWYPPLPINYYYFGHLVTAVLTRLSGLDLAYAFNLMLATIFAFTFTMSFSIGKQLIRGIGVIREIWGGILTAFLVTLAGNMQTIYAFTSGYGGDDVKPFWELTWNLRELWDIGGIGEIWGKIGEGMNTYWYANATRFIPWTIHEFPSYSFVVSDVHGHVLSIPFVLLAIGLLIQMFGRNPKHEASDTFEARSTKYETNSKQKKYVIFKPFDIVSNFGFRISDFIFYGFLVGVLLMTNALDGPVYLGLFLILLALGQGSWGDKGSRGNCGELGKAAGITVGAAAIASLPFLSHFKSFVNGVAVNCPLPQFANSKIGLLIFEGVEKCQRSP